MVLPTVMLAPVTVRVRLVVPPATVKPSLALVRLSPLIVLLVEIVVTPAKLPALVMPPLLRLRPPEANVIPVKPVQAPLAVRSAVGVLIKSVMPLAEVKLMPLVKPVPKFKPLKVLLARALTLAKLIPFMVLALLLLFVVPTKAIFWPLIVVAVALLLVLVTVRLVAAALSVPLVSD